MQMQILMLTWVVETVSHDIRSSFSLIWWCVERAPEEGKAGPEWRGIAKALLL